MTARDQGMRVEGASHRYGATPVVRDVTLAVPAGEIHSLLGPSGSGKTTLLRLIAGLEVLQTGQILIGGRRVAGPAYHVPPEARSIGFVFQDYALFPHLNVHDNVLFGMPKKAKRERRTRADELLDSVGMSDFARAMPHTLSGGQQQRVALARALAREPVVMLLDEPFSGLDDRLRGEIRELTADVLRSAGVATLLVTHDPEEALLTSDVVTVIRDGRIEQTAAPAELYFRPQTLHVAEVFGETNRWVGTVQDGGVATPWGTIETPSQKEGETVTILFRPESLLLRDEPTPESTRAIVRRNSLRGETSTIELALPSGENVTASVPGYSDWRPGTIAHVAPRPHSAIVLPGV